jgi:hypothetical protein
LLNDQSTRLYRCHRFSLVVIRLIGAGIDRNIEVYPRGVIRHRGCDFGAECASGSGGDSTDDAFPAFAKKHGHLSNQLVFMPNHLPQNRVRTVGRQPRPCANTYWPLP